MSESFILLLIAEIVIAILGFLTIYSILMHNQYKRLEESSKKLQAKINLARSMVEEFPEESSGAITNVLGNMGIDGLIDSLGIPSVFKPIAKGFIDNILKDPAKLKGILDKLGIKLDAKQEKELISQV